MILTPDEPLAKAIQRDHGPGVRVIASVGGQLFVLDSWSLKLANCKHESNELETSWTPLKDRVKRWTVPLRWRIQMKLAYWRQKIFG